MYTAVAMQEAQRSNPTDAAWGEVTAEDQERFCWTPEDPAKSSGASTIQHRCELGRPQEQMADGAVGDGSLSSRSAALFLLTLPFRVFLMLNFFTKYFTCIKTHGSQLSRLL